TPGAFRDAHGPGAPLMLWLESLCGRLDRDLGELVADTLCEFVPHAWRVGKLLDLPPKTGGQRDALLREHRQRRRNRELRLPEPLVSIDDFTRSRHSFTQRRRQAVNINRHSQILAAH